MTPLPLHNNSGYELRRPPAWMSDSILPDCVGHVSSSLGPLSPCQTPISFHAFMVYALTIWMINEMLSTFLWIPAVYWCPQQPHELVTTFVPGATHMSDLRLVKVICLVLIPKNPNCAAFNTPIRCSELCESGRRGEECDVSVYQTCPLYPAPIWQCHKSSWRVSIKGK